MEELESQQKTLFKALSQLEKIIFRFQKSNLDKADYEDIIIFRDAAIKRFEFCYDLFWKFLKSYLEAKYGISQVSPKKIFKECFIQGLINEEVTHIFLNMTDDRNLTTHTYSEDKADETSERIVHYFDLMISTTKEIKL